MENNQTLTNIAKLARELDQELKQLLINDLINFKFNDKGRFLTNNQGKNQGDLAVA